VARTLSSTLFASLLAVTMLGAVAAPAAAAPYFRAELAAPAPADRLIVRDLVWKCGGGACTAGKSNSRAANACAGLVRQAGAVRGFSVAGRALGADELEKCNARAR
jgi:hypothetical protein